MKFLALMGSPRKSGNCAILTKKVAETLESKGNTVETLNIYDMNIHGCVACMACREGKVEICTQQDEFTALVPRMIQADGLIFSTPVYMGQISGPMKVFFDRWCTFIRSDWSIRHISGKKYVTIVTSGAPADAFKGVTEYLKEWLTGFFKLECQGSLLGGELMGPGDVVKNARLMKEAEGLARALV